MKKLLCALLLALVLTGCYTSMPGTTYHHRNRTFATKTHAKAYALRMRILGYQVEERRYQQWWNHGTYWYGVYIKEVEEDED